MRGVVEEIGLTYTWMRTPSGDRLVVPNEKLASDTIRNSTIRGRETVAEVTVEVPARPGLGEVLESLEADGDEAYVERPDGRPGDDRSSAAGSRTRRLRAGGERPARRARRAARRLLHDAGGAATTTSTSSSPSAAASGSAPRASGAAAARA